MRSPPADGCTPWVSDAPLLFRVEHLSRAVVRFSDAGNSAGPTRAFTARLSARLAAIFTEEKPALQPLPIEPFRYYQYGERTVHLDGCVEVEAAYYSAPPGWIGRRVRVQWESLFVRLLHPSNGLLLREHVRQQRGRHRIKDQDLPRRVPATTQQQLHPAERAGQNIGALCRNMHDQQGPMALRRILGVLSLVKKYGPTAVDEACSAGLELGVCEYHFVRRYLERRTPAPLSLRQVDPLIRQLTLLSRPD